MSDRTPADVIAEAFTGVLRQGWTRNLAASSVLAALAAAGYRVVPIPDDNTRALAARLREWHAAAVGDCSDHDVVLYDDLLTAAAYLDGQPQDRPAQCPNPDCHDGWVLDCDKCREKGLTLAQTDCSASGCRVCGGPMRGNR